jgi:hypothetical protein
VNQIGGLIPADGAILLPFCHFLGHENQEPSVGFIHAAEEVPQL